MSRVLLVGSGGREHALLWKLLKSPRCSEVILAPGGEGMEWGITSGKKIERWDFPKSPAEYPAFARRAKEAKVDLAVIGPDNPLADGIVDELEDAGVLAFGPRRAAAQLEASKAFAKDVMTKAGVPTAEFQVFTERADAEKFVASAPWPPKGSGWVIKADGLAFGKGVVVCDTRTEAEKAVAELFPISGKILIEQRLSGREVSWMAFCDGDTCSLLEPARDFKRIRDGDEGPNTGGMGAFSPIPEARDPFWAETIREKVFLPVLREMKRRGTPFRGLLYAGLMIDFDSSRFWVIEFNSRFGDPEAQVLLSRMSDDLVEWCEASAKGKLSTKPKLVPFKREAAVIVVGAAAGYPDRPEKGARIEGWRIGLGVSPESTSRVFCAGVSKKSGEEWLTSGGRVLGFVGMGRNLREARDAAYALSRDVHFPGMQVRKDIALQASIEEQALEGAL